MKKLLILSLTILMAMGLAACSSEKPINDQTDPVQQGDVVKEEDPTKVKNGKNVLRFVDHTMFTGISEVEFDCNEEGMITKLSRTDNMPAKAYDPNKSDEEIYKDMLEHSKELEKEGFTPEVYLEGENLIIKVTYDLSTFDDRLIIPAAEIDVECEPGKYLNAQEIFDQLTKMKFEVVNQ